MAATTYYLKNRSNRKFATVPKASTAEHVTLTFSTRNNSTSQRWRLEPAGNGYYYIINQNNNLAMSNGKRLENSIPILQVAKASSDDQLWLLQDMGNGYKRFINKYSKKALCISGAAINRAEAPLIQYDSHDQSHFGWYLLPATSDYNFGVYLQTYKDKTISLKVTDIPRSSIENVDLLPTLAAVPLRPDTQDAWLQAVVSVGTALGVLFATAGSGGLGLPFAMAGLAGVASMTVNSQWLMWPTDSSAQWAVLDQVYQRTSSLLCAELVTMLEGPRTSFENRAATIRKALDNSIAGTATAVEIQTACNDLSTLDMELTKARTFLTFINNPYSNPDIWNKYDGDKSHPELIMRYFVPYLMVHSRILLALCMLSDEYNGRGTVTESRGEAALVNSFLSDTRAALVKTLRSRQEKAVSGYTVKEDVFIPVRSIIRTSRGWYVLRNGIEVAPGVRHATEELAKSAVLSLQQAAAAATYAKDEALRVLFNSIRKAFEKLGIDSMASGVAPISEQETRWGKY